MTNKDPLKAVKEYRELNQMCVHMGGYAPDTEGLTCYAAVAKTAGLDNRFRHALGVADNLYRQLTRAEEENQRLRSALEGLIGLNKSNSKAHWWRGDSLLYKDRMEKAEKALQGDRE